MGCEWLKFKMLNNSDFQVATLTHHGVGHDRKLTNLGRHSASEFVGVQVLNGEKGAGETSREGRG